MLPIARGSRRVPKGVSASLWRRLRVFGSWAAAAGKPLTVVSRPVDFDERSRVVRIAVASQRWAAEIGAYEEILRKGMEAASGERIARLDLTVAPDTFEPVLSGGGGCAAPPGPAGHGCAAPPGLAGPGGAARPGTTGTGVAAPPGTTIAAAMAAENAAAFTVAEDTVAMTPTGDAAEDTVAVTAAEADTATVSSSEAPVDLPARLERLRARYLAAAAARRR